MTMGVSRDEVEREQRRFEMEQAGLDPLEAEFDDDLARPSIADRAGEEPLGPFPLGPYEQLSLDVGGIEPNSTSLSLRGGKIQVEGEVKKGERLTVQMDLVVTEVAFRDRYANLADAPLTSERSHVAKVVGTIRRV